jgi:hypothetical protein
MLGGIPSSVTKNSCPYGKPPIKNWGHSIVSPYVEAPAVEGSKKSTGGILRRGDKRFLEKRTAFYHCGEDY